MRPKGTGTQRADGTWRIVVTLTSETGVRRKVYVEAPTQREVQRKAAKVVRDHERGRLDPGMTLKALLDQAMERRFVPRCDPRTVERYRSLADIWIVPMIGMVCVESLKPHHVESVMRAAAEEGKTRTANLVRTFLRAALKWAMKQDLVDRNAAALADPVRHTAKERPMMLRSDLARVIAAEPSRVRRALWTFLAETGLRPGEALALVWDELHEIEGEWWVRLTDSKTPEGKRPIPLDRDLVRTLEEIRRSRFVFATESGTPFIYRNISRDWKLAVARCPDVTPTNLYQLRKLYGREMARVVPDHVLKRLMRHTHIQTTKQFYVDAEMGELRDAVNRRKGGNVGGTPGDDATY